LDRITLGPGGLDLAAQLSRFETLFDEGFAPKHPGSPVTLAHVIEVAAALGLDAPARTRLAREFSRLRLTDLAADVAETTGASPAADPATVTLPFLARVEWADHHGHAGVTGVRGRLVIPRGRDLEVAPASGGPRAQLAALVRIDETSSSAPTAAQLTELVAPAVLGNLLLAYLAPPDQLKGSALEAFGRLMTAAPTP
jgi:hypothetical protein